MRKLKIEKWKAKTPDGKETEEDVLMVLSILISNKKPEEIPKGLDKFRLFSRLSKAFDKATKTNVLELEETEYMFLKETIEKDIPSIWAMNPNVAKSIEDFMNAKME